MKRYYSSILAVAAATLTACSTGQSAPGANARLRVSTAALKGDVTTVSLHVTGTGVDVTQTLGRESDASFAGLVTKLPAGVPLRFTATASGTAGALYTGFADATPVANKTIAVTIILNEINPGAFSNNAPVINSLVASADTIAPGDPLSVTVDAADPDPNDTISYAWTVTDGVAAPDPIGGNSATVDWTAPRAVTVDTVYTLRVVVSDNRGARTIGEFAVTVSPTLTVGAASIVATVNDAPRVSIVELTPLTAANNSFTLVAQATDTETPNQLTFSWARIVPGAGDPCANGVLSGSAGAARSFDATQVQNGSACTVEVVVTDPSGGRNTGRVTFIVGAPTAGFPEVAPSFVSATYSATPRVGTTVTFSATFTVSPPVEVTWYAGPAPVTPGVATQVAPTRTYDAFSAAEITDSQDIVFPAVCPAGGYEVIAVANDPLIANAPATYTFAGPILNAQGLPCP